MELQLTGSGLAEGRDPEAYVVHLSYALFYPNASGQPARRAEYSTPIYASVHAVPVAERSVQGGDARSPRDACARTQQLDRVVVVAREAACPRGRIGRVETSTATKRRRCAQGRRDRVDAGDRS